MNNQLALFIPQANFVSFKSKHGKKWVCINLLPLPFLLIVATVCFRRLCNESLQIESCNNTFKITVGIIIMMYHNIMYKICSLNCV